jgi:hypothetical protein
MPFHQISNSVVATSSGMIGGLTKAYTSGFQLCSINVSQIIEVSFYAAISALVGYGVKLGVDTLRKQASKNSRKH